MPNKTVIFFGAGATLKCGMPVTNNQSKLFNKFFFESNDCFRSYIKENMDILKDEDITVLLDMKEEKNIQELIEFVKATFVKDTLQMMKFYNLVDIAISERRGFSTSKKVYTIEEITHFRESLLQLLQVLFGLLEKNVLQENPEGYQKLKQLFKAIAENQLKKRVEQHIDSSTDLQSKEFIFTDISYVSLNWDVLILWAMMTAHKELNNENKNYISDKTGIAKLKVFNDFFTYLNSYDISESQNSNKDWFPYNQTVAYRLNDTDHPSDRRIILFPAYFPHGQTHWLECPLCGKLTMYIDKQFRQYSENFTMQSKRKYQCANCGNQELTLKNSAMLLQTNYKIKAPYIEEIQRAMRIAINKAEKLIFIGYSLPNDDIEYESIFRISRNTDKKVYIVLYQKNVPNQFLSADSAIEYCKDTDTEKAINRYCDIFGKDNVHVNLSGFPNAYDKILELIM
ncbi:MAG: hypothetical protein IKP69_00130 [Oscillospiraceae bacterium]|nr:hypothetical protein [Oscillospiraceae bacterium]